MKEGGVGKAKAKPLLTWWIDIDQRDLPVRTAAGGLIEAPDRAAAMAKACRAFRQYESWRVSVKRYRGR